MHLNGIQTTKDILNNKIAHFASILSYPTHLVAYKVNEMVFRNPICLVEEFFAARDLGIMA